jgi:hypothetical protein
MDHSQYPIVIGAGGYGVVRTGTYPPHSEQAMKYLYKQECPSAKKEFMVHKRIYDAWTTYVTISRKEGHSDRSIVPEPLDYTENESGCKILTERLFTVHPRGDFLVHIALAGNTPPSLQNRLIPTRFDVESTELNRGYFFDEEHIRLLVEPRLHMEDVVYNIGLLTGIIIFGAHYDPYDCEFVLCEKYQQLFVAVIDFGKAEPILSFNDKTAYTIASHIDLDLYYSPGSGNFNDMYYKGIMDAYRVFEDTNSFMFYKSVMQALRNLT